MGIIVDCDSVEGVIYAKVLGTIFDVDKFLGEFAGSHDFDFAGALSSLDLLDGAPGNGTARATDKVAGE